MNTNIAGGLSRSAGKARDENPFFDAMGMRLISLLRVTLAISGLLLTENFQRPLGQLAITTLVLCCYVIYSAFICGLVFYYRNLPPSRWWHWMDVAWWLAAIASTGSGSSIFYLFFIYPIIVASFRWGTNEGVAVSVAAVVSWLLVTLAEMNIAAWPEQMLGTGSAAMAAMQLSA